MNNIKRDKIAGAIYGFAIGDAMGATTEFMTSEQVVRKYGKVTDIIGGGWLNLEPGEITDDTQMTMCVMDALMKFPKNIKKFENLCSKNFIKWFKSEPKDIGNQCFRGISHLMVGQKVERNESALGNGSLMRALPCALLGKYDFNEIQGRLTHNNTMCDRIIFDYTKIILDFINDFKYDTYYIELDSEKKMPTGYVLDTFINSIHWSNKETFEEAIIGAVNDGGDADTIAAITGSIAGAKHGYKNIPQRWIDQLDESTKDFLENFKNFVFSYLQI